MKNLFFFLFIGVNIAMYSSGVVSSGSPHATRIGQAILDNGGNAFAASIGTAIAIFITDPANASLAGRSQILYRTSAGEMKGIGAATRSPAKFNLSLPKTPYSTIPVPGNPKAIEHMLKLSNFDLKTIIDYIMPLTKGFQLPPKNRILFTVKSKKLKKSKTLAPSYYQKSPKSNFTLKLSNLKTTLEILQQEGISSFYKGSLAKKILRDLKAKGSSLNQKDFETYHCLNPKILHMKLQKYDIYTLGGNTWGHVLIQLLKLYKTTKSHAPKRSYRIISLVIDQVMKDQPVKLKTLVPKLSPPFLKEQLLEKKYIKEKSMQIKELLDLGDTTHFSVIDSKGNMVSWTTSLGPWFGSGALTPEIGIHYAYSYRMASNPTPLFRDHTEMSPTLVFKNGKPYMAIGAAGSERIPVAIFWVLKYMIFDNMKLKEAVSAPRFFTFENYVRIHSDFSIKAQKSFKEKGYKMEIVDRNPRKHLGIVHAAIINSFSSFVGAEDPSYGGISSK